MKFSTQETALLLKYICNKLQQTRTEIEIEQLTLLQTKLKAQEYIKGRLLKLLYSIISEVILQNTENENELKALTHKINFKATPR